MYVLYGSGLGKRCPGNSMSAGCFSRSSYTMEGWKIGMIVIMIVFIAIIVIATIGLPVRKILSGAVGGNMTDFPKFLTSIMLVHAFSFGGYDNRFENGRFFRSELTQSLGEHGSKIITERYLNYTDDLTNADVADLLAPMPKASFRSYIHCFWNTLVYSHSSSWENRQAAIIVPLMSQVGRIFRLNPNDTMILDYLTVNEHTRIVTREAYQDRFRMFQKHQVYVLRPGESMREAINSLTSTMARVPLHVVDSPYKITNALPINNLTNLKEYLNGDPLLSKETLSDLFFKGSIWERIFALPLYLKTFVLPEKIEDYINRMQADDYCQNKGIDTAKLRKYARDLLRYPATHKTLDKMRSIFATVKTDPDWIAKNKEHFTGIFDLSDSSAIMLKRVTDMVALIIYDQIDERWRLKIKKFETKSTRPVPIQYFENNIIRYANSEFVFQHEFHPIVYTNPDLFSGDHASCFLNIPPAEVEADIIQAAFTYMCDNSPKDRFAIFPAIFRNKRRVFANLAGALNSPIEDQEQIAIGAITKNKYDRTISDNFDSLIQLEQKFASSANSEGLGHWFQYPLIIVAYYQWNLDTYLRNRSGIFVLNCPTIAKLWELAKRFYYTWIISYVLFRGKEISMDQLLARVATINANFVPVYAMFDEVVRHYCSVAIDNVAGFVGIIKRHKNAIREMEDRYNAKRV